MLHCNHRSGHLKTEHTESLFLLRRHLGNRPWSRHEKQTAGSAWETWTVTAADGVHCDRVRWEINFLLTFETTPFFCVYPVYIYMISFSFNHLKNCKSHGKHILNMKCVSFFSVQDIFTPTNIYQKMLHMHTDTTVGLHRQTLKLSILNKNWNNLAGLHKTVQHHAPYHLP